jgi:hypothetical protein
MAAEAGADVHHRMPRYLLGHFDAAAEGFTDWSKLGAEAERLSMEVRVLSREGLMALIESSTREIPTTEHRTLHQEASDFVRWGRRGGQIYLGKTSDPEGTLATKRARPLGSRSLLGGALHTGLEGPAWHVLHLKFPRRKG